MIPDPRERPVMTAEEAFAELGIERHTGYKAIREGTFPVPVLRIGKLIRVPTSALRKLLLLDGEAPSAESGTPAGDEGEATP
jgi:predicted DNA-binding transcriptional regulator AlpA